MSKEELKKNILEAIKKNPYKKAFKQVSLFGSYAYGKPHKDSDLDILIEFEPSATIGLFKFAGIQRNFEESIGKRVDLVTPDCLSKYLKDDILNSAEKIYEKRQ